MGNAQAHRGVHSERTDSSEGACMRRIFASVVTSAREWEKKEAAVWRWWRWWNDSLLIFTFAPQNGQQKACRVSVLKKEAAELQFPFCFFNLMQTQQRRRRNKTERHDASEEERLNNVTAVSKRRRSSHILIGSCTNKVNEFVQESGTN